MSVFIILFRELDLHCNVLAHLHRPILEAVLLMIFNLSYFRVYYIYLLISKCRKMPKEYSKKTIQWT